MKNIQKAAMAVCLAGILFSGCGSQKAATPPPASSAQEEAEKAQDIVDPPKEETAAQLPYITVTKDFDNLQLGTADIPVYDAYTLAERRANGMATALPELTPYREKKVAYLTFDDGPDDVNTPAILEILRKENVKATFYVVGRSALTYPDIVKQIFLEGHAIGNHSYDHDYDRLYASVSQYLEEMENTDEILHGIIGVRPLITRAPGGRIGHFTGEYVSAISANGYVEHDWNVSSADTAPNHPVAQDFIDNIEGQATMDSPIILMHCSSGHEETVKALPGIIRVLRDRGYAFGVVTPMTPQPW